MFCPSCGHDNLTPGKFCAKCGTRLPEEGLPQVENVSAAVPPPPIEAPIEVPEPFEAPAPPPWAPPAAPVAPAPVAAPIAPAPVMVQPVYIAPPAYAPVRAAGRPSSALRLGGFLALAGGAAAAGSAWLPSLVIGDEVMKQDNWLKPWDKWADIPWSMAGSSSAGDWSFTHPSGHILVVAGVIAAVCGLVLMSGMARAIPARLLLALVAVAGAVAVLAMEYAAYGAMSDMIDAANKSTFSPLITMGFGLYVGAAGGAAAILGSLIALSGKSD